MYTTKINHSRTDLGVSVEVNIASAFSPIFTVLVPEGVGYRLYTDTPFIIKLYQTGGAEIDSDSKIIIAGQQPGDRLRKELGVEFDYRVFATLTAAQQTNKNYQERTKVELPVPMLLFKENEKIVIMLNSSDVVDWTEAATVFEFKVEEVKL